MKNTFPKISVVMLNYNGLRYLEKTIYPILELDYPNYEFIMVDNGSTDGSIELIKKFKKIRLIKSPRLREKNFACNYAIKRAKGEYILLLDNDALIKDSYLLKNLISQYLKNKETGILALTLTEGDSKETKFYGGFLGYYFSKEITPFDKNTLSKLNNILIGFPDGKGFFIKKKIWMQLGGYDEHYIFGGDDTDIGIKSWLAGYKNNLYSKTIQTHLGLPERQNNQKYSLKFKETFYAQLSTIVKNYNAKNVFIALIGYSCFSFLKSIKQSAFRLHLGPFFAFFQGYYLFLKNLRYALKKRKEIQSNRVIKEDIFLKIKPPRIN